MFIWRVWIHGERLVGMIIVEFCGPGRDRYSVECLLVLRVLLGLWGLKGAVENLAVFFGKTDLAVSPVLLEIQ